ncbi:MAG: hypothetical protein PHP93_09185 [Kiritimatiellales bacterium]|nr:hypothetical protein [Kiritimatiellales bacterium]
MTIRDQFKTRIEKIRKQQIIATAGLLSGFIISIFNPLGALLAFPALFILIHAYQEIKRSIECPACHKSLGYLLTDPNYSKGSFAMLVCPPDLPLNIHECPYCKTGLEDET